MAEIDIEYHKLLNKVLKEGKTYQDPNRKGINRLEIPYYTFEYKFEEGFPAITTKRLYWRGVVGENLWILRGDTNIKYLVDNNISIWNADAYNYSEREGYNRTIEDFLEQVKIGNFSGDLGRIYGHQLRRFGSYNRGGDNYFEGFDQLAWIINEMKNNPLSTKKDVTYINPCDKNYQALTPCHTGWSINFEKDLSGFWLEFKLSSSDLFLGAPFNIAGYGLIAKILEKITSRKAIGIRCNFNNLHIYEPHLEAVKKQLENDPNKYGKSYLEMAENTHWNLDIDTLLEDLKISDIQLRNYESYPPIKAEMIPYIK